MKTTCDVSKAYVEWKEIGFGVTMYLCFVRSNCGPVGFVWGLPFGKGQGQKSRFEVLGSYVVPAYRRNGIRTLLNQKILEHSDVITSQIGSAEGGAMFMRDTGYRLDERIGVWVKNKSKKSSGTTHS